MKDRFALDANQVLLQQAIALDLAHYERPEFHDLLSRAQQSGGSYLLRVLDILTRLVGQVVGLVGLLALLLKFNPAVTAILFLRFIYVIFLKSCNEKLFVNIKLAVKMEVH